MAVLLHLSLDLLFYKDPFYFLFQQREKLSRDARKALITAEFHLLFEIVAFKIELEPSVVEELVLDGEKVCI